jgi:epoxide hydrolase-like predicted phosphatase
MSIRAVLFDIGGVLEFNPPTGWRERWARRLRLDQAEFEARLDALWAAGSIGAVTIGEVERRTASLLAMGRTAAAELMDDVWAEYVGSLNHELAHYFQSLRPRFKTALVSNSFVGAREREQELYGFDGMCDAIVYSHEVGYMKPDARIYHHACDRLGVAPAEAVLVDDVQANVDGARAIGMRAVTFVDNRRAIAELEAELAAA